MNSIEIVADRKAGMSFIALKKKYRRATKTIMIVTKGVAHPVTAARVAAKPVTQKKSTKVARAQKALAKSNGTHREVWVLSYGEARREYKFFNDRVSALREAARSQLFGAKNVRLWREVPFEITAVIKED